MDKIQFELVDDVLTAVKGVESFYEKFGFCLSSAGMIKELDSAEKYV